MVWPLSFPEVEDCARQSVAGYAIIPMVAVTITNQNLDLKRMVRSELAEEMNCLEGAHDIGFLKLVKGIFRRAVN